MGDRRTVRPVSSRLALSEPEARRLRPHRWNTSAKESRTTWAAASVYLYHDQVQKRLRSRKGARIAAASNRRCYPLNNALYRVVAEPDRTVVGTVDEEFAVESMRGDVFLLGNTSWQIVHVRGGDVTVVDAHGAPPTVPFWQGRSSGPDAGTVAGTVASPRRSGHATRHARTSPKSGCGARPGAAMNPPSRRFVIASRSRRRLGLLPNAKRIVFERFFDENGRDATGGTRPVRSGDHQGVGFFRCGSGSVARSTSSCRRPRTTTGSFCRSVRSIAFRSRVCFRF